jgi:hypothetical protein
MNTIEHGHVKGIKKERVSKFRAKTFGTWLRT